MKLHYTPLLVTALLSLGGHAQTLNVGNFGLQPGMSFTFHRSNDLFPPGPAVADQTWDFSGLSILATWERTSLAPASAPNAASFPGATVATSADDNATIFDFFSISSSGWELRGRASEMGVITLFDQPKRVYALPLSYNTSWTGSFTSSTGIIVDGTPSGEADGHGTLVMPYGPVTNVLRERTEENSTNTIPDYATAEISITTYHFIKPGVHWPIATCSTTTVAYDGGNPMRPRRRSSGWPKSRWASPPSSATPSAWTCSPTPPLNRPW
jgi:hypothetical protein